MASVRAVIGFRTSSTSKLESPGNLIAMHCSQPYHGPTESETLLRDQQSVS